MTSTVIPAWGFTYHASLHSSAPLRLCKYSLHILLLDCWINFWSSACTLAASSTFHLLLFSLLTSFLLSLMSAFRHLVDLAQILMFIAMGSRMLPIASWHHAGSCSILSAVRSASRWDLSFAHSIHSFSAASTSSSVNAAKCHTTTLSSSASSCLSASSSHSITSWSDPLARSSASMDHPVIGRFATIRSMTDSPSWPSLVQWWVALPSFSISSPFPSITSSKNAAFPWTWHLGSHRMLCGMKSPMGKVPRCQITLCQFNFHASLTPNCAFLSS